MTDFSNKKYDYPQTSRRKERYGMKVPSSRDLDNSPRVNKSSGDILPPSGRLRAKNNFSMRQDLNSIEQFIEKELDRLK